MATCKNGATLCKGKVSKKEYIMTKTEALIWLRKVSPSEFFTNLEYMALEDLIYMIYDNGLEIVDRMIHVESNK